MPQSHDIGARVEASTRDGREGTECLSWNDCSCDVISSNFDKAFRHVLVHCGMKVSTMFTYFGQGWLNLPDS
jgi:hypothetical protein